MNIDIIVVYIPRYERGHEIHFVPPITGIHLAALTPASHNVKVIHQQTDQINFDTDADLIALSFFSGFAPEAYRLAKEFKKRGKMVIAGGPHATFSPKETLNFVDSVIIGESESVWSTMIQDAERNALKKIYYGQATALENIPTPRYDLLSSRFFVKRVVQATRGCPNHCSFCTVPTLNPGFRTRPIADVISDIKYNDFRYWWQKKVVWFWDDNLTIKRNYIKKLLEEMIPLKKWWLTQASMDIANDSELLDLMKKSGCIGIFFGIESFDENSLKDAQKTSNKIGEYRKSIKELHKRGICVMAGFISGFDSDSKESIEKMAKQLNDIGVDVPFLSILTPYRGTAAYQQFLQKERLCKGKGWEFFNGYNVGFIPAKMTGEELLLSHRKLWSSAFSAEYTAVRLFRSLFTLRLGAFLMCLFMNVFYCFKATTKNYPKNFENDDTYRDISKKIVDIMHDDSSNLGC